MRMSVQSEQLLLSLRPPPAVDFDSYFVAVANAELVAALRAWLLQDAGGVFFIAGAEGSGRSHLLQAACTAIEGAFYLPLNELKNETPDALLEGLESCDLLCLDDIDAVLADADWCEALFYLFNRQIGNPSAPSARKWLVAARASAMQLDCALPDLQSRLSWGGSYRLLGLDDDERLKWLQLQAHQRGMALTDDIAAYILQRYARDIPALMALLEQIDRESLRSKQRITIPFIRKLFDVAR